jgi:hypothetical protein
MSQTVVSTARAARAHVRRSADDWITTTEAGQRARSSKASIVRWVSVGALAGCKVVGRWRVDPDDLDRLLAGLEAE